jgi:hypothetical protein
VLAHQPAYAARYVFSGTFPRHISKAPSRCPYCNRKILVSADMGGPPPAGSPAPANVSNNSIVLYQNIKRLKLDVTTHVPIHGNPGPQAEFDRIVGPAAARAPQTGGGG